MHLTPTEPHLLELLPRHAGPLVSLRKILHEVWGPAYEKESHYPRLYMAQLGREPEPEPARPRHRLTEPGLGYRPLPSE